MKKLLLLLLLIPNLVMAEEWIDTLNDGTVFIKKNSAENINNKIRFEQYVNVENKSIKYYSEINCNEKSITDLNTIYYSDNNLKGEMIGQEGPDDKFYPPPSSYIGTIVKVMCNHN